MNKVLMMFALIFTLCLSSYSPEAQAGGGGPRGQAFTSVWYFSAGATGSGKAASDPAGISSSKDLMTILDGMVITAVDVIVTTAVTGSSPQINVGDDDAATGFHTNSGVTEGTPGVYSGDGSYIATGAKKYYSSAKTVKYSKGGTLSAGVFAIAISGYRL